MSSLDKLRQKIQDSKSKGRQSDDRFWKFQYDPKTKEGSAIIRFLPAKAGESSEWVKYWTHFIQGDGGVFAHWCPTTWGENCPVCEYNTSLYKRGMKDQGSKQKRQTFYVSNILVVKDPKNPEAEGKVFLYRYGNQVFKKLEDAIMGNEEMDIEGINPFSLKEGADLVLKSENKNGFPNYENSQFKQPKALSAALQKSVPDDIFSLEDYVSKENGEYFDYDALKKKLIKVIGKDAKQFFDDAIDLSDDSDDEAEAAVPSKKKSKTLEEDNLPESFDDDDLDLDLDDEDLDGLSEGL